MILSNNELNKLIRPLQWEMRVSAGGRQFYTPKTDRERQLFWIDFVQNILAPNLKRQTAVLQINTRIQLTSQPVILDKSTGNLRLPSEIEVLMHYARDSQAGTPFRFAFGECSSTSALTFGIAALVLLGLASLK